jgi:hypothetical protein
MRGAEDRGDRDGARMGRKEEREVICARGMGTIERERDE